LTTRAAASTPPGRRSRAAAPSPPPAWHRRPPLRRCRVNLNIGAAGIFTGTANLALASHDADLADLSLATSPPWLKAQVNNYAALALLKDGGDGTLSRSFDLDFGGVALGSGTEEALLAILNNLPLAEQGFTDLLSSTATVVSGSGFRFTGCSVNNLLGRVSQGGCDIFFDTDLPGMFTEVLSFAVESSNSSGCHRFRDPVTLTIHGIVEPSSVPEPSTMTIFGSGLGTFILHVRRRRRTG
jgi:hypothetical protein